MNNINNVQALTTPVTETHCQTKTLGAWDIAFGKVFSRQTQGTKFHPRIHIKMVGIQ